jgi:hypothetical protein
MKVLDSATKPKDFRDSHEKKVKKDSGKIVRVVDKDGFVDHSYLVALLRQINGC